MKTTLFFLVAFFMSLSVMTAQNRNKPNATVKQTTQNFEAETPMLGQSVERTDENDSELKALQRVREADSRAAKAKREAVTKEVAKRLAISKAKRENATKNSQRKSNSARFEKVDANGNKKQ